MFWATVFKCDYLDNDWLNDWKQLIILLQTYRNLEEAYTTIYAYFLAMSVDEFLLQWVKNT